MLTNKPTSLRKKRDSLTNPAFFLHSSLNLFSDRVKLHKTIEYGLAKFHHSVLVRSVGILGASLSDYAAYCHGTVSKQF